MSALDGMQHFAKSAGNIKKATEKDAPVVGALSDDPVPVYNIIPMAFTDFIKK